MGRITEALVRSRSEHNELQISTLEELSLHQQDIERIEYIDKWCKDLKILYLQSNLINKIENVSRLKNLQYLNLALNCVERIENLEGCESLQKLDLTVNFVGELTTIDSLKFLPNFNEMYLTGNPCTEFTGYRRYVVATLPHLKKLDGTEIERSERIQAGQNYSELRKEIVTQEQKYLKTRAEEKSEQSVGVSSGGDGIDDEEFWKQETKYTPESRLEVHKHMEQQKNKDKKEEEKPKKERRLFNEDGRALNINEAKVDFTLSEDVVNQCYVLDIAVYRHLHTSLVDVDVQPRHVRATIKGKIFQLSLEDEVRTDDSSAQRSQTTGHLVLTLPWVKQVFKPSTGQNETKTPPNSAIADTVTQPYNRVERLEVDLSVASHVDLEITKQRDASRTGSGEGRRKQPAEDPRENSPGFIDDPDVPPLV